MKWGALSGAIICALLWGSAFPGIKTIYRHWHESGIEVTIHHRWLLAGIRFSLAGLALWCLAKRPWQQLKPILKHPRQRNLLFGMSAGQTLFQYIFFYWALAISSGALAALFTGCGSLWWLLLAPLVLKSPWPRPVTWIAISLGITGVIIASYAPNAFERSPVLGAFLLILATGSGTVGILCYQQLGKVIGARTATGFSLFLGGLALTSLGFPAFADIIVMHQGPVWIISLWLTMVSALAFSLWNHLATLYPVSQLANYRLFIPIAGMLESVLWIHEETLSMPLVTGAFFVIAGALIARKTTS